MCAVCKYNWSWRIALDWGWLQNKSWVGCLVLYWCTFSNALLLPFRIKYIHIRVISNFEWRRSTNIIDCVCTCLTNSHVLNCNCSLYSCTVKINLVYWPTNTSLEWAYMETVWCRSIRTWTYICWINSLRTISSVSKTLATYGIKRIGSSKILRIRKYFFFLLSFPAVAIPSSNTQSTSQFWTIRNILNQSFWI